MKTQKIEGCPKLEDKTVTVEFKLPSIQKLMATHKHIDTNNIEKFLTTHVPPSYRSTDDLKHGAFISY